MYLTIAERLMAAQERFSSRPFLINDFGSITYADAWDRILRVVGWITDVDDASPLIGVLSNRSINAYVGTLAILAAGRGYVPLTGKTPPKRLRQIAAAAELRTVIVDIMLLPVVEEIFEGWPTEVTVVVVSDPGSPTCTYPSVAGVTFVDANTPRSGGSPRIRAGGKEDLVYLLFTSGSTGAPKGVPISNANVCAYLDYVCARYQYGPEDRHSQTFELSFDLSVHDILVAWTTGGALVPLAGAGLLSPAQAIERHGVTCWFSVPSQAALMERARALRPGSMPSLRVSLFCGEALPVGVARAWSEAAPNSLVENLYGPTEATIAFTHHRFDPRSDPGRYRYGVVPIGQPFDGQSVAILDLDNHILNGVGSGELLLGGSQLSGGYWKSPETTAAKFITLDDTSDVRWYRTGDLVERDNGDIIHFVGRLDHQIKFRGHRIELAEIEAVARRVAETPLAVVLDFPIINGECMGLVGVVSKSRFQPTEIRAAMRKLLPAYMIPKCMLSLDEFPRNQSGKIDRSAIRQLLLNGASTDIE